MKFTTPQTIAELTSSMQQLAGRTLQELADIYNVILPDDIKRDKGWLGQFFEYVLGADARNQPRPDFTKLGIELKTIPIKEDLTPLESTYVCHINLHNLTNLTWEHSLVYQKLIKVLWIPIITDTKSLAARIVATPFIWQPTQQQLSVLQNDWHELMELMTQGTLEEVCGKYGEFLQVRPKAANSKVRINAFNQAGEVTDTLPRGFYLRASFTKKILQEHLLC